MKYSVYFVCRNLQIETNFCLLSKEGKSGRCYLSLHREERPSPISCLNCALCIFKQIKVFRKTLKWFLYWVCFTVFVINKNLTRWFVGSFKHFNTFLFLSKRHKHTYRSVFKFFANTLSEEVSCERIIYPFFNLRFQHFRAYFGLQELDDVLHALYIMFQIWAFFTCTWIQSFDKFTLGKKLILDLI